MFLDILGVLENINIVICEFFHLKNKAMPWIRLRMEVVRVWVNERKEDGSVFESRPSKLNVHNSVAWEFQIFTAYIPANISLYS